MADSGGDTTNITMVAPAAPPPGPPRVPPAVVEAALPLTRADPRFPPDTARSVRVLRFMAVLDDATNQLSPTKINVWSANLGAISVAAATVFSWLAGHVTGIESVWVGALGWLTQAHTTNHFSKREKDLQRVRMSGGGGGQ